MGHNPFTNLSKRAKITVGIYFSIFLFLAILVAVASRDVIFQAWTTRNWISAVAFGNNVYIFGGRNPDGTLCDEILQIDVTKSTLKRPAVFPYKCVGVNSAVLGDRIFILGGYDSKKYLDAVFEYNPVSQSIEIVTKMPKPLAYGNVASVYGNLYYIGGWDGNAFNTAIFEINPEKRTTRVIGYLEKPRQHFAAVSHSGKILIIGGEDKHGNSLDDILEIDTLKAITQQVGKLPEGCVYAQCALMENQLFVTGIWDTLNANSIIKFNLLRLADKSSLVATVSERHRGTGTVSIGNYLYMIGGKDSVLDRQLGVLRIDPKTGKTVSQRVKSYAWW